MLNEKQTRLRGKYIVCMSVHKRASCECVSIWVLFLFIFEMYVCVLTGSSYEVFDVLGLQPI